MDVKSVFSASVLVFLVIGTSSLPVPVPVSYDGLLTLDVVRPDRIVGDFYPQENIPEWYIKFSVVVENEEIVSRSKLVLVRENRRVPFTVLKIPSENKHHKIIVFPNIRGMVLQAAKDAFATYKANQLPDIRELVDVYDNLANAVHRRLSLSSAEVYQFASSIMYHSTIVGSVWRLTEGTTENNDICRMSLTFANRIRYFICAQDLQRISTKSENFIDDDEMNTMSERLSKRAEDSDFSGSGFVPGDGNGGTSGPSNGGGGNGGTSGPSNGGGGNTNSPPTVSTTTSPPTTSQATTSPPTTSQATTSPPTTSQATTSPPTTTQATTSTPTTGQATTSTPPIIFGGPCRIELGINVSIEKCLELLRKLG